MGGSPSLIWHLILWGRQVVEQALVWRIGDGHSIRILQDKWICKSYTLNLCVLVGLMLMQGYVTFLELAYVDQYFTKENSTAYHSPLSYHDIVRFGPRPH